MASWYHKRRRPLNPLVVIALPVALILYITAILLLAWVEWVSRAGLKK